MRGNVRRLRAFGHRVRQAQDTALRGASGERAIREARSLFLASAASPRTTRRGTDWLPWLGAASVLAAAASVVLFLRADRAAPMTFEVGPAESSMDPSARPVATASASPGAPGQWIAAPNAERLPLHFSDGSLVRLEPSARARVVDITDAGGRVALEGGTLHAEIVHRQTTRWSVEAGPFEVRVTGTKFDVAWDASRRAFRIALIEGSVAVSGCDLAQPRVVAAGETFDATCHGEAPPDSTDEAVASPSPPSAPARSADTPVVSLPAPATTAPASWHARIESPAVAPPAKPTWREALAHGRYAEALDLAESLGLPSVCGSADASALMDLGDAARFAGRVDRAKVILLEVRRRFPGDAQAATAAFNLGRIAFDDEAAFVDAAVWFDRYLTELPSGPLVREARGRRMEALEKGGDHASAVRAAAAYLEAFPEGPHAKLARSIEAR